MFRVQQKTTLAVTFKTEDWIINKLISLIHITFRLRSIVLQNSAAEIYRNTAKHNAHRLYTLP